MGVSMLAMSIILGAILGAAESPAPDLTPTYPVYFVSPSGNDAWSGALPDPSETGDDGPFATLGRALEVLRTQAAPDGHPLGATVHVRAGDYTLTEPLRFEARDSGRENLPVMFRAYKNETVRLRGAVTVTGFEPHEGAILKASTAGLLPAGKRVPAVYWEGARQTLARWPNAGGGDLPGGEWTFVKAATEQNRNRTFQHAGDRPATWSGLTGVEVSIWPNYNWWQTIAPVASITDGVVTLGEDLPYTIEAGRRYFFQNVREELDAPGEWYHDVEAETLYFWPPGEGAKEVQVPVAESLLVIEGGSHINLWGFTLEMTAGTAVTMRDAHACMLAKSTIRHTQDFGVEVSGGGHCRLRGNDIYATGRGGISLSGGDRVTLTPGNHQAINNRIHDFGVLYQTYQTGINVSGVGNTLAHNLIHDAPHIGILLGGNDHVIEYNEIHHVCMQGSDNGGFYMGRDWTQRGNIIRHNKFHDIYGFGLANLGPDKDGVYHYESPHQAWAVYLDDCSSGTYVYGNWFYRVPLCGVMIGGGRDNVVENNVFVDCIPALHIDDRWDSYPWDVMHERLKAMNPEQPPYSERYPELLKMGDDPRKPENNRFVRNIIYYRHDTFRGLSTTSESSGSAVVYDLDQFDPASTLIDQNLIYHEGLPVRVAWSEYGKPDSHETIDWATWQSRGFDANSIVDDPLFFSLEDDNYRLKGVDVRTGENFTGSEAGEQGFIIPVSPATQLDWQPIPAHLMGLIDDEFRASPPPPPDSRREGWQHRSIAVKPE